MALTVLHPLSNGPSVPPSLRPLFLNDRQLSDILIEFVSAAQRRKQMGQRSDDVFLSYISRKSGVDSQAILNGQKPDQPLMDLMQSIVVNLDIEARQGSDLTDIGRKGLRRVKASPDKLHEPDEVEADECAAGGGEQPRPEPRCYQDGIVPPLASPHFRKYLASDLARLGVVKAFYEPDANSSFGSSVAFLSTIADPAPSVWRYPQAEADERHRCKPCGQALQ